MTQFLKNYHCFESSLYWLCIVSPPLLTLGAHLRRERAADYTSFYFKFYLIYYLQVLSLFLPSFWRRKYKAGLTMHSEESHDPFLLWPSTMQTLFVALQPYIKKW